MYEIDRFFAKSIESTIIENLGNQTITKIKSRLAEKFGIGIYESISQFSKFFKRFINLVHSFFQ